MNRRAKVIKVSVSGVPAKVIKVIVTPSSTQASAQASTLGPTSGPWPEDQPRFGQSLSSSLRNGRALSARMSGTRTGISRANAP